MDNLTGLPDVSQFDSSIPADAKQELEPHTEFPKSADSTFSNLLDSRGIIEDSDNLEYQIIKLVLKGASTEENDYMDDRHTVGSASFHYSREDEIAIVGSVGIKHRFRKQGLGTRLKKQLVNHMKQKGAKKAYTWIESEGGRKLAQHTGFRPENDEFEGTEEIWVRSFD